MGLIRSMRPIQWVKNLVVFAGVIFARHFDRPTDLLLALAAFAVFCALASGVYLLNDIRDRASDSAHPEKRNRPIAAGRVSVPVATAASVILLAGGLVAAALIAIPFLITCALYVALNISYSFVLKRLPLIDVMSVAMGFVLRAVGGAEAIAVAISPWLVVCTLLLALFLGFGKRRWEVESLGDDAIQHRSALAGYTTHLLDQLIAVTTASTVVAYALYTLSPETQEKFGTTQLIWTLPFVIYGVFRYLFLIHRHHEVGNPTRALLTDVPILVNGALWMGAVLYLITKH
jgi:4-hydroxybenzoate polyprenyltransferase